MPVLTPLETATRSAHTLRNVEVLRCLTSEQLSALSRLCQWRLYAPRQQIIVQGESSSQVFFVCSGHVRATMYARSGRVVTFQDLGIGEMFGELAAIDGMPRATHVVSLGESLIASVSSATFWELLRTHPSVAEATLRRLSALARRLCDRIYELSTTCVGTRIQAELLRLADEPDDNGNTAIIRPLPTHADLASRVSTHREAVTRELGELARAGVVERVAGGLLVLDLARLRRMVAMAGGVA